MVKGADAAPWGPAEVMSLQGRRVEGVGHVPSKPRNHRISHHHYKSIEQLNCICNSVVELLTSRLPGIELFTRQLFTPLAFR